MLALPGKPEYEIALDLSKKKSKAWRSVEIFIEPVLFNMDKPEAIKGFNLGQTVTSVICPLRFYSEANTAILHFPTTQNIISNSFCVAFSICFYWQQRLYLKICLKSILPTILTSTKDRQLSISSLSTQNLGTHKDCLQ